jgi:hypothetical protein
VIKVLDRQPPSTPAASHCPGAPTNGPCPFRHFHIFRSQLTRHLCGGVKQGVVPQPFTGQGEVIIRPCSPKQQAVV